jgi:hypothetical protein
MELNERFKLLTNYNVKNTLTENVVSILNEDAFTQAAREGLIAAKELEGVIKTMKADSKIAKELESLKTGGVQTADDLLSMLKLNKLSAEAKGLMNSSILKSSTGNAKMLELAAQDLVKSPAFANKYYKAFVEGGKPGLENALKQSGKYSEGAITKIVSQSEKNLTTLEKMSKVKTGESLGKTGKTGKAGEAGKAGESGKSFETGTKAGEETAKTTALAKESHIQKYKDKFKSYYESGKGRLTGLKKKEWFKKGFLKYDKNLGKFRISKRKILAWAAVAMVTYSIMKSWLGDNGIVEDPIIDDTNTGGGGTGGGGTGGGTSYSSCTDFPYKKGCKSTIVSEVQGCLGLTADGRFGPKTEKALIDKGYSKEISQETYDKIKVNCGSSSTTSSTTTTTTINPATNYDLTNVDASNASSLFK